MLTRGICCSLALTTLALLSAIGAVTKFPEEGFRKSLTWQAATASDHGTDNDARLKILPIGASIVWGVDSTDGNGFRLKLRDQLEANGNKHVEYVGTLFHGNMSNNAVEAYPGHTIDQVQQKAEASGVYAYIPNVILVHLGTNDCMSAAHENSTIAASRFTDLLSSIKSNAPHALVLASTLIPNLEASVELCIKHFNSHLPGIVKDAVAGGQNVTLVNMYDAVRASDINTTDATHPTDAGYAIMADVWYHGLVNGSTMLQAVNSSGKAPPRSPSGAGALSMPGSGFSTLLTSIALMMAVSFAT